MKKIKAFLVSLATIASVVLAAAAIVGAAMACSHALILLVPAVLLAVYPSYVLVKSIKAKLAFNR